MKLPEAWKVPPFKLNVNPELPDAVALILPLLNPAAVGFMVVPVTVMVTPAQGLGTVSVNVAVPVHPLLFFAVIVYEPAARLPKIDEP
jgi:hypothetical protein